MSAQKVQVVWKNEAVIYCGVNNIEDLSAGHWYKI
jgi:hypothetical protein